MQDGHYLAHDIPVPSIKLSMRIVTLQTMPQRI